MGLLNLRLRFRWDASENFSVGEHAHKPVLKVSADNPSDLSYADKLWQTADKLRGTVDAAEYKHVVLGLLFLKYISDSFESRRARLKEELEKDGIKGAHLESLLESRDEYTDG